MHNEIMNFIGKFQNEGTIKTFTEGCCYWFAKILEERFQGTIMYNPITNHFATLIDTRLYDINGDISDNIELSDSWYFWKEYEKIDSLETERINRYCINKID